MPRKTRGRRRGKNYRKRKGGGRKAPETVTSVAPLTPAKATAQHGLFERVILVQRNWKRDLLIQGYFLRLEREDMLNGKTSFKEEPFSSTRESGRPENSRAYADAIRETRVRGRQLTLLYRRKSSPASKRSGVPRRGGRKLLPLEKEGFEGQGELKPSLSKKIDIWAQGRGPLVREKEKGLSSWVHSTKGGGYSLGISSGRERSLH